MWLCVFVLRPKVHPKLHHLKYAALAGELFRLKLLVDNAAASRHPLNVTWSDLSATTTGVSMFDLTLERDSHCLETLVWVCSHTTPPIGWWEFIWRDVIEQQERAKLLAQAVIVEDGPDGET